MKPAISAITLAGGVAKGAFEAGALAVLAQAQLAIGSIVASSCRAAR